MMAQRNIITIFDEEEIQHDVDTASIGSIDDDSHAEMELVRMISRSKQDTTDATSNISSTGSRTSTTHRNNHNNYSNNNSNHYHQRTEEGYRSSTGSGNIIFSISALFNAIFIVIIMVMVIYPQRHPYHITTSTMTNGTSTTTVPPSTTATCEEESMVQQPHQRLSDKYLVTNVTLGMVASDQRICSQRAIRWILQQYNGTAVDAAIFVALCLGVVNPASSGLGGGAFLLLHHIPNDHWTSSSDENEHGNSNNIESSSQQRPKYYDARTIGTTSSSSSTSSASSSKVNEVIDCRERAPMKAHTDMYQNLPPNASVYGSLAIPIMGELHCLYLAHDRFGTLPWSTLVQPVIDMAMTEGIVVGSYLARQIHDAATHHYKLQQQDPMHQYYNQNGEYDALRTLLTHNDDWSQPLQEGDVFFNIPLGTTLRSIAEVGIDALYQHPFVSAILDDVVVGGGSHTIITAADYQNYLPTIHTPIISHESIQGYTIMGVPPPSSGGATLIGALRFLANFSIPMASHPETLTIHRIVEACKHVFSLRMSLSDPDYNTHIVQDVVQDLIASSYMDQLRQSYYNDTATLLSLSLYGGHKWSLLNDTESFIQHNITDAKEGDRSYTKRRRRQQQQQQPKVSTDRHTQRTFGYLNDHGTSHFSVVDQYGNAVAMTTSINTNFGSHIRGPDTGIIFSNTMDDFSKPDVPNHYGLKPSVSNYIQPMKRPLSSMTPTMVFRKRLHMNDNPEEDMGDLVLVIGASGGPKIITAVLQVLIRIIFMGQNVFDAVLHPRIHNQLIYHNGAITATEQAKIVTTAATKKVPSERGTDLNNDSNNDNDNNEDTTRIEYDINVSQRTRDALLRRQHELIDIDFSGTVQAIYLDYETSQERPILSGVSDPRKDGTPAGY